jgi:hypothetical protein
MLFAGRWIELESIMLSEISQTVFSHMWNLDLGEGETEVLFGVGASERGESERWSGGGGEYDWNTPYMCKKIT